MNIINDAWSGFNGLYNRAQGSINSVMNHPITKKCQPVVKWGGRLWPLCSATQRIYNLFEPSVPKPRQKAQSSLKSVVVIFDTTKAYLLVYSPQYLLNHRLTVMEKTQKTVGSFLTTIIDNRELKRKDLSNFFSSLFDRIEELQITGVSQVLPIVRNPKKQLDNLIWVTHYLKSFFGTFNNSPADPSPKQEPTSTTATNEIPSEPYELKMQRDEEDRLFVQEADRLDRKESKSSVVSGAGDS